jgi:hypothetical protein
MKTQLTKICLPCYEKITLLTGTGGCPPSLRTQLVAVLKSMNIALASETRVTMYVCMKEGWATSGPCTATITDLLCFLFDEPFINHTLRMKRRTLLMGVL